MIPFWTDDMIIAALRDFYARHGDSPTYEGWQRLSPKSGDPSMKTIVKRFGTFNKALGAAGLPTRKPGTLTTTERCVLNPHWNGPKQRSRRAELATLCAPREDGTV